MKACVLGVREVLTPACPLNCHLSPRRVPCRSAPLVVTTEWRTWLSNTVPPAPGQVASVDGSQLWPLVITPPGPSVRLVIPATVLVSHIGNAYIDWFQFDRSSRMYISPSPTSKLSLGLNWMFEVTLLRFSVCWKKATLISLGIMSVPLIEPLATCAATAGLVAAIAETGV